MSLFPEELTDSPHDRMRQRLIKRFLDCEINYATFMRMMEDVQKKEEADELFSIQ